MEHCVRFRLLYGAFCSLTMMRCLGCKFDFLFFPRLCRLCSDCRCEHDGQGHGGPDSEERQRQRHGGVHLPGGELHRRLPPLGVAHRGGRCVGRHADYRTRAPSPQQTSHCFSCLSSPHLAAAELPPSPLPSQTYLEIFIYCLGFFIIVILTATAVVCRLCCAPKKSDFNNQLAVQKLAKSIPLRRQVGGGGGRLRCRRSKRTGRL